MPGRRTPPTLARNQSPPAFSARSPRDASGRESPGAGPKGCLGRLAFRAAGSLRPAPVKRPETWNGEKQQPFSSKGCSPWIAVHKVRKMRQPVRMNKQFTVCHSGIPGDENQCLGTSVVKRLAVAVRFPVLLFSQVGFFFMPVTWAQRLDSSSKVMSRYPPLYECITRKGHCVIKIYPCPKRDLLFALSSPEVISKPLGSPA
ncbi:uncharacterized protein LOC117199274 isoform X2 [Orcinus orca]|uniref:uncharacterized protein LOC117199274 isoform X2 n=1 Tax=Orcinus orca TaxID=9733 RepID=UPI001440E80B|nr:uncharacterized protein LOC117199274 isoform X2 [Orcinus orca]